jgi:DNA-directed RNA polymerase subunit E'/Rpb7
MSEQLTKKKVLQPEAAKKRKKSNLYVLSVITRKVTIPFQSVGSNLKQLIQQKLVSQLEGKCTVEGYVRTNSIRVLTYSSGILKANNVIFDVALECLLCTPVEGLIINTRVVNITKAGLRCDIVGDESPLDIFVARDHHFTNKDFSKINEGDTIIVKVLGQRYEINDLKISVIAELTKSPKEKRVKKIAKKPLLVIK